MLSRYEAEAAAVREELSGASLQPSASSLVERAQAALPSERRQTLEYLLEIIERSLPDVRIRVSYPYP